MQKQSLSEMEKEYAKEIERRGLNPLEAYSTSQLKAELRRRKKEGTL